MTRADTDIVPLDDGYIDLHRRAVVRDGHQAPLTGREVELLRFLVARPGQPADRQMLLVQVWGYHPDTRTRAVDAAVKRLRSKLESQPHAPRHLVTIRGEGYLLVPARASREALIGRTALLTRLNVAPPGVIGLTGPHGIGKSAIARTWRDQRNGLWVDLTGARNLVDVLREIAFGLGVILGSDPPSIAQERIGRVIQARGLLGVVLDGADGVLLALPDCLTRWRETAPQAVFLVTSRAPLADVEEIRVSPLARAEAEHVFRQRLVAAGSPAQVDRPPVRRLLNSLGGNPLALELAAASSVALTASDMLARLDLHPSALEAAVEWSWALLDPSQQRQLAALSLLPARFHHAAAAAVTEVADTALPGLLDALLRRHLLVRRDTLYEVPAFVRHLSTVIATGRARMAYAAWVITEADRGHANLRHLLAAERHLPTDAFEARCAIGIRAIPILFRRGPQRDYEAVIGRCAAAATHVDTPALVVPVLLHQAALARSKGELEQARTHAEAADAHATSPALRAQARVARANIARYAGRTTDAGMLFADALRIAAQAPPAVRAEAMRAWANLLLDLGEFDDAQALNARALFQIRLAGDRVAEAVLLGNLGVVTMDAGRDAEARAALSRAAALHATERDTRMWAVAQSNLGVLHHLAGELAEARTTQLQALETHRQVGNPRFEGYAHYQLAALCHEQGDPDAALTHLGHALSTWQIVNERRFLAFAAIRLALVEVERGALAAARAARDEAGHAGATPAMLTWVDHALSPAGSPWHGEPPTDADSFVRINYRLLRSMARRGGNVV